MYVAKKGLMKGMDNYNPEFMTHGCAMNPFLLVRDFYLSDSTHAA